MVEAFAILFVFIVALLVGAFSYAARPAPAQEREQLEHYLAWLEDRWRYAQANGYDESMRDRIASELATARQRLADLHGVTESARH